MSGHPRGGARELRAGPLRLEDLDRRAQQPSRVLAAPRRRLSEPCHRLAQAAPVSERAELLDRQEEVPLGLVQPSGVRGGVGGVGERVRAFAEALGQRLPGATEEGFGARGVETLGPVAGHHQRLAGHPPQLVGRLAGRL